MNARAHGYVLRGVESAEDWAAYHAIRRDAIFAVYRPGQAYDPDHPDETKPNNFPHVLVLDGEIIGTVRIDFLDDTRAALRLIGIRTDLQSQGHGAMLLRLAEDIVRRHGRRTIVINATVPALRFYLSHGYREGDWSDVLCLRPDLVRLGKRLAP
jgi:ribosomal protein S18 acetylase RimI-like enzyme